MRKTFYLFALLMVVMTLCAFDNVKLFQQYFIDSQITKVNFVEGDLDYGSYDNDISSIGLYARGGFKINPKFDMFAELGFLNFSYDDEDESGLVDPLVGVKYNFTDEKINASAGLYITLPIGEEKIGQENFNFGLFGALRYPVKKMEITGSLGILSYETWDDDRDLSISLSGGLITPVAQSLYLIPELVFKSDLDYAALSCGVDYSLANSSQLRGALLLGMDDGAPDLALRVGYKFNF